MRPRISIIGCVRLSVGLLVCRVTHSSKSQNSRLFHQKSSIDKFTHSFIHSFIYLFIHSFIHSFILQFISFTYWANEQPKYCTCAYTGCSQTWLLVSQVVKLSQWQLVIPTSHLAEKRHSLWQTKAICSLITLLKRAIPVGLFAFQCDANPRQYLW